MGEFLSDPELDRLVAEMNRLAEEERRGSTGDRQDLPRLLDAPALRSVGEGEPLELILNEMFRRGASDLVLVPGAPPALRIGGRLHTLDATPVESDTVRTLFAPHLGARSERLLADSGSCDLSLRMTGERDDGGWRLRVNLQRQRGELAAAVRALPRTVPTLDELDLPPSLADIVRCNRGLVLVCGPTGSGKSTTLAALLDVINRTDARHVITIEDPVEYEHVNRRSIFEQVEIGSDADSFSGALRSALRRDADVILVGEMRDLETMAAAIRAAETGHLILSTLHTGDATQAVHRVIDVFPASQQTQIRHQLALSLHAVMCQQLVPRADGSQRVPALEVMTATQAVRNLIRRGHIERLYNEILQGHDCGMLTLETSLAELVSSDSITVEEARSRCVRPDELERILAARG